MTAIAKYNVVKVPISVSCPIGRQKQVTFIKVAVPEG
jgi:hypothetical protein